MVTTSLGCTAYAKILAEIGVSKLSPRSIKYILISYFGCGAYKLWDRASGTTIKSRDVIFKEGQGHRTVTAAPTSPFDTAFDNNVTLPSPDTSMDSSGVIILPKPLAPHPCATDPPPHAHLSDEQPLTPVETQSIVPPPVLPRRSARLAAVGTGGPPPQTTTLMTGLPETYIPQNYKEVMARPDLWMLAMEAEWAILMERKVFRLIDPPPGAHVINLMWVYANKYDTDGNVIRHKARLVAKGFSQIPSLEYDQTYVSVVHLESFRMVAAIAASLSLHIWQVNIISAFLYSPNEFPIYMHQPSGFVKPGEEGKVLVVDKSLYGMMQATFDFQVQMSSAYEALGYYKSLADPCVHSQVNGDEFTLTSTYMDNIFGTSSTKAGAVKAKDEIESCFEIKDVGELGYILGIHVDRDKETGVISLSQTAYLQHVLEHFGMVDCNPKSTPLPPGISLSESDSPNTEEDKHYMKDKPYCEALGTSTYHLHIS